MKILFITATRLGDGVLSTGLLGHLIRTYPNAKITVACGPLVAGIFAATPNIERVIPLKKEPYAGHWLTLAQQTFWEKWDIIVDLRNSLLSRILRADKKYIWGKTQKKQHKVEQLADVLSVSPPPAPQFWFNEQLLKDGEKLIPPGSPVLAIGPSAKTPMKTWPAERFVELAKRLTKETGPFHGARLAIFAAPGEEEPARAVLDSVPAAHRIDLIAKTTPLQAAAALSRCTFYIGNDSGLMHTAAAVGIPTLGLFGPSWPYLYRPWGKNTAYVTTPETCAELIQKSGHRPGMRPIPCLMTTLSVDDVEKAAISLWDQVKIKTAS